MPSHSHHKVTISFQTIVLTALFMMGLILLFFIQDILIALFFSVILMSAFNPLVNSMQKRGVPRPLGILILYVITISVIAFLLTLIVPPLAREFSNLVRNFPIANLPQELTRLKLNISDFSGVLSQIGGSVTSVLGFISSTFSSVFFVVTVLVMSFYLLMDRKNLHKKFHWFNDKERWETIAKEYIDRVEIQLGSWVRGQLILMFVVGFVTYIALLLLGIPYALPLAVIAGLLEILPNLGPTLAAVPAVIIAFFMVNPTMAIFVLVFYILVQQFENSFLVPKIMKSAVDVEPLTSILLILMGIKLGGVAGALLSVPFYLCLRTFIDMYVREVKNGRKS